ncbi:hypothetical protein BDF20DRAFT_832053 [Mycotypha africana]|uniref:uncharacterized protein n=1 Tax=Mycotypha africana TaxID=64632 RepID=UPI0023016FF4|nr:uncharacterized protein BDF20DRAFT_832053 [Mycotypha africana]KAI8992068.1 hypothetical protein BDF20DRAFT_832053 [Mycotypha africana]
MQNSSHGPSDNKHDMLHITLHQISFLITGLCTTLGMQWLFYKGAATSMSLLPQLSSYTGMLLIGAFIPFLIRRKSRRKSMQYNMLPSTSATEDHPMNLLEQQLLSADTLSLSLTALNVESKEETKGFEDQDLSLDTSCYEEQSTAAKEEQDSIHAPVPHLKIIKLATLELFSSVTLTIGFSIIGSGMYQVIYSSVVIWCAILTWIFMKQSLSKIQWLAIIGTSIGLGICSFDNFRAPPLQQTSLDLELPMTFNDNTSQVSSHTVTLGGTLISACIYVYSDKVLSSSNDKGKQPLPAKICCWMGVYTSCYTWIWMFIYTLPRFADIIHIDANTTTFEVTLAYTIVTVAHTLHSYNYYELIDRTGNVATGILQGLRAILVYAISHASFCQNDSAQCFTASKGFGSLVVIGCVLLFTLAYWRPWMVEQFINTQCTMMTYGEFNLPPSCISPQLRQGKWAKTKRKKNSFSKST